MQYMKPLVKFVPSVLLPMLNRGKASGVTIFVQPRLVAQSENQEGVVIVLLGSAGEQSPDVGPASDARMPSNDIILWVPTAHKVAAHTSVTRVES